MAMVSVNKNIFCFHSSIYSPKFSNAHTFNYVDRLKINFQYFLILSQYFPIIFWTLFKISFSGFSKREARAARWARLGAKRRRRSAWPLVVFQMFYMVCNFCTLATLFFHIEWKYQIYSYMFYIETDFLIHTFIILKYVNVFIPLASSIQCNLNSQVQSTIGTRTFLCTYSRWFFTFLSQYFDFHSCFVLTCAFRFLRLENV